jgi:hypothetical protein
LIGATTSKRTYSIARNCGKNSRSAIWTLLSRLGWQYRPGPEPLVQGARIYALKPTADWSRKQVLFRPRTARGEYRTDRKNVCTVSPRPVRGFAATTGDLRGLPRSPTTTFADDMEGSRIASSCRSRLGRPPTEISRQRRTPRRRRGLPARIEPGSASRRNRTPGRSRQVTAERPRGLDHEWRTAEKPGERGQGQAGPERASAPPPLALRRFEAGRGRPPPLRQNNECEG